MNLQIGDSVLANIDGVQVPAEVVDIKAPIVYVKFRSIDEPVGFHGANLEKIEFAEECFHPNEAIKMSKEENERLEASIAKSEESLAKGLFQPEDASQIRRMIAYERKRIQKYYKEREE
jgi:hypothetical protein